MSESSVTLTVFHPYEKKVSRVEREFTHAINVKDYMKGLQGRIVRLLDGVMAEAVDANLTKS